MNDLQFYSILFWQVILCAFLFSFKDEISSFLTRLRKAEILGQKILAGDVRERQAKGGMEADVGPILAGQGLSVPRDFKPVLNPTALYFLGHDLTLTYTALLTGSRQPIIELTMRSASAHLATLGFDKTDVGGKFSRILQQIQETKSTDWTAEMREEIANDIWVMLRFFGGIIQHRQ